MSDQERIDAMEKAVEAFSVESGKIMGRLCSVLVARGVLAEFDTEYIGDKITSDEWREKYKESLSPTGIFKTMIEALEDNAPEVTTEED